MPMGLSAWWRCCYWGSSTPLGINAVILSGWICLSFVECRSSFIKRIILVMRTFRKNLLFEKQIFRCELVIIFFINLLLTLLYIDFVVVIDLIHLSFNEIVDIFSKLFPLNILLWIHFFILLSYFLLLIKKRNDY